MSSVWLLPGFFIPGFPKLYRFQAHHDQILAKLLPKLKRHLVRFCFLRIFFFFFREGNLKWFVLPLQTYFSDSLLFRIRSRWLLVYIQPNGSCSVLSTGWGVFFFLHPDVQLEPWNTVQEWCFILFLCKPINPAQWTETSSHHGHPHYDKIQCTSCKD